MFFIASKVLTPFIYPFTYVVVLLLFALFFYRHAKLCKGCLLLALLLLFSFGTPPLPNLLTHTLESRYPRIEPLPEADAVVVLSGMLVLSKSSPGKLEFGEGVERILAGIHLIKEEAGKHLILSGGSGDLYDQNKSEARLLERFAIELGVSQEKLLVEPSSRNTYENALYTKALMEEHGIDNIILVTSASHLPRAIGCFRKFGIEPIPYGVDYHARMPYIPRLSDIVPNPENFRRTSSALHEYIGILMYKISGYL